MGVILLVVADAASLGADDVVFRDRLQAAGHTVTLISDETAAPSVDTYDGFMHSESCVSSNLGSKYVGVAKPGILCEFAVLSAHSMAGAANVSTTSDGQWSITATTGLSGGLSGTHTISTGTRQNFVDTVGAGAQIVGRRAQNTSDIVYFAYETGAQLTSGTAAARRAALGYTTQVASGLTADGQTLLDTAINWAFGPTAVDHPAAAAFAGAGALAAAGSATRRAQAAFAGSGSLGATATTVRPAQATFTGSGSLSASATRVSPAVTAFAGTGTLAATPGQVAQAAFAGSGQMVATARQTHQVTVGLAGVGGLQVSAHSTQQIAVTFTGSGAIAAAGVRDQPVSAAFVGSGQIVTDARRVHPAIVSYQGAGELFVNPVRIRPASVTFAGAGRLTVQARVDKPGLNVSLWAVVGTDLAPLPAFENLEVSRERNGVGSVSVDYPAAAPGFDRLKAAVTQDRPVEVEIWFGGSRDGAERALLTQTVGDDLNGRAVWRFTGTFLEQILDDGVIYPQPAPAERGELVFNAKNPGEIVATVLQQAQARGVLAGVTRDWTTAVDSSGQAWPNTISGLKYSPRTTLLQVLQDLVEKDYAEFELTAGRVLRLWAPDRRGVDRATGVDPTVFRFGRVTASPVRHSTRDTVTAVLAVGADGLSATASDASAEARIGRRIEVGVDANNITDQGALLAYAQAALKALTKGQEELRHPLAFGPGDPRPKAGYDLADKVLSERAGGTRRAVDVQQWTLTAERQRVTGGEVILNDLIASRLQRLARQVDRITSGAAVVGTSEPPEQEDTLAPAAPIGLTADSIAYQDDQHSQTLAAVTLSWTPVTTNSDTTAADDVAGYQVQFAYLGLAQVGGLPSSNPEQTLLNWYQATPSTGVSAPPLTFGGIEAGVRLGLRVAAFDNSGNQGAWSTILEINTASDNTAPAQAAAPGLAVWFRTIDITSNGLDVNGAAMPVDFDHDEIWISQAATFTVPAAASTPVAFDPAATGPQHVANLFTAGTWNQPDIPVGVGYYAARRSVDRSGNPGPLSPIAGPVTAEKLVQIDLGPNAVGSQQIIDLEVIRAKIDNLAVNSAKVEEIQVGLVSTGTLVATVTLTGTIQTATTGLRWVGDPAGIRFYNSSGTLTIDLRGSAGSALITGTLQSALSGERWVMMPDGTLRLYPASGTNYSQIANLGNDVVWTGPRDANGRSGRVNVNALGVGLNFSSDAEIPNDLRAEVVVFDRRVNVTAPLVSVRVDTRYTSPDGGPRRAVFAHTTGSPPVVNAQSVIEYKLDTAGNPGFVGISTNAGWKAEAGAMLVVNAAMDTFVAIKASDFVVSSAGDTKEQIADIRAVVDPIKALRQARARKYIRTADRWYTPPPTPDNPDPEPVPVEHPAVQVGVIAEEMPEQVRLLAPAADGGTVASISVPRHVALLHGALNQILDQEIRTVHGAVTLTSGIWLAGSRHDVPVEWDEEPLDDVRGAIARLDVGVAWQGAISAAIKRGSITATGCVVTLTVVSASAVALTAGAPVTVHADGLYLYAPPYTPLETP